jgi:hypothetical protein
VPELDEADAVERPKDVAHLDQARRSCAEIDLGDVPGDDHLDPNPSRVRNICICSGVVFCASSRITNESLKVRPRMNASGATSIVLRSMYAGVGQVHRVVERVEQAADVRVDLREHVPGGAQTLAGPTAVA